MLAEIVTLTIPDWICCVGWGVLCVGCFILALWLGVIACDILMGDNKKSGSKRNNPNIVALNNASLHKALSCSDVISESDLYSGKYSSVNCSACNDKGTIQGRQCSCQVVKYWKGKKWKLLH